MRVQFAFNHQLWVQTYLPSLQGAETSGYMRYF